MVRKALSLLQDERLNDHYSVSRGVTEVVDLTNEIADQSTAKRRALAQVEAADKAKKPKHGPASSKIVQTYWDSPEAKKLFLEIQVMTEMFLMFSTNGSKGCSK
ncbi:hypothetical protein MHU86_14762 [Fragilaria crotonensis]|nr:hypothetical protein MHU86_14762 [Fragilaria crotonensis]